MFLDAQSASVPQQVFPKPERHKSFEVLITDDNDDFRGELVKYMRRLPSYRVVGEARDGMESVSMTKSLHPDLVLMDISMPRLNGVGAAKQIKEFSSDTKIIFVTIHE